MIRGGIDKNLSRIVPSSRFDSCVFVNGTQRIHLSITQSDRVFGQQRHERHIGGPNDVAAFGDLDLTHGALLLYVEQREIIGIPQEQHSGAGIEDFIARGSLHLLRDFVFQIFNDELKVSSLT
jgi:hypothetical protein